MRVEVMNEIIANPLYPCPCCGYMTLYEQPPGTYLVCPICFWEDRGTPYGLSNAQRNFLEFGAVDRRWLGQVRSPTEQDRRIPNWRSLDAWAAVVKPVVIQQIEKAFEGTIREDGVTLHEAAENDYWGGSFHPYPEVRSLDTDTRWQDVPDAWLDRYYSGFHYLDMKGWRYYIPAYMRYWLKCYKISDSNALGMVYTFTLSKDERHRERQLSYFQSLTENQSKAVCQFLRFVATFDDWDSTAQQALDAYWSRFCTALGEDANADP